MNAKQIARIMRRAYRNHGIEIDSHGTEFVKIRDFHYGEISGNVINTLYRYGYSVWCVDGDVGYACVTMYKKHGDGISVAPCYG